MSVGLDRFIAACPGVFLTRDIDAVLHALPAASSGAAITAAVVALMPEGNPPQYTAGAPPTVPLVQPGATPILPPALPPQPMVAVPASGGGTVLTFAKGLPRFADSNPDPVDGWSIERSEDNAPGEWS